MKKYTRILSLLLALSMLFSLCTTPVFAEEKDEVKGSISATLRLDYAQKLSVLRERSIQVELIRDESSIVTIPLTAAQDTRINGYPVQTNLRDADGGDLLNGDWPTFLDVNIQNLPQGNYTMKFTGRGYRTFEQEVTIKDFSQHVMLGTSDATFTLGDLNGDGKVTSVDQERLSENLGKTDSAAVREYDLNGDGQINIVDLAYVTRNVDSANQGIMGTAEVRSTYILSPADQNTIASELVEAGSQVRSGELSDLFQDNGKSVQIESTQPGGTIDIPIPLRQSEMIEEIKVVSPEIEKGTILVEYQDGITEEISFDNRVPVGVYAISRDEGKNIVTVDLGRRVAVKKVTISVAKTSKGYVTVESIEFLREIVPETPVAANNMVKNLEAVPSSEKVELRWDTLPNVTGYRVVYYLTDKPETKRELPVNRNRVTVDGLENLKEYTFVITPTADAWVGKPVSVASTPIPSGPPDAPDMVTVSSLDGALYVTWKNAKNATYYKVFYAKENGEYQQSGGKLAGTGTTITGLENGSTYLIYIVAGNDVGEGKASRIYQGTPETVNYDRPAGIPTEGVLDYTAIEKVWLAASYNVSPSSYAANRPFKAENMYDGDFSTHWTSHSYGDGNWWNSKKIFCTFKEPVDISSVIWVPRLDGGYAANLRVYTVTVWQEGEDLEGPGHVVAPNPETVNAASVNNWLKVRNNPAVTKFAVLPFEPTKNVVKVSITIEQVGYSAVSLSELMFMQYDPMHSLPDCIDALFADTLHTTLAAGVTHSEIDALRTRLNSDEKNYYLNVETMADELALAEELLTGESKGVILHGISSRSGAADSAKYGQAGSELQPLGVAAKAGDEITIYASGIPSGQQVSVYATQYNAEVSAWRASLGTLENGKNIFVVPKIGSQNTARGGSLYLTYSGTSPEDVSLHIRRATDIPVLELSQWYTLTEMERKELIGAYLDELGAYPDKVGVNGSNLQTNCLNVTEISMPSILLSIPAQAVLTGVGYTAGSSRDEMIAVLYRNVLAWEDVMHICKTTQGIDRTYQNNDMTSRQNIRCMQMFAGAFMYAAGNHIGIGYNSCAGMVRGKPVSMLPAGTSANGLFGWGIAHEIGHNMDKLGKAEITNNIYSLMVQTYDGQANTLTSRLEASNKYEQIFTKVAQGYPGASNNVFVQLGMYWQLHLAYDDAGDPMGFYNRFFKAWKNGTYTQGAKSYDDKVALTAAGVSGKDLTEFFTRWGMSLSQDTLDTLRNYAKESRAIWYLTDQSRRERINASPAATGNVTAVAALDENTHNEIVVRIDASGINGTVQGYEILRNGVSIGFTTASTYTDVIGTGNHKTYEYQVKAYDILGNQIGAAANAGQVRVAYDATLDPADYTVRKDGTEVTFTLKRETSVSGIKLRGTACPNSGSYTVTVTDAAGTVNVAKTGDFSANQAVDDLNSFLAYFNKPGADSEDTRIWTYDAKTVTISGIPETMEASDVMLVSYAGDDVSFLSGCFAGRLSEDYVYGTETDDVITAGTLVIVGNYRGDPVYNGVKIRGRFTATSLDENGEPVTKMEERDMDGYSLLFAEIPKDGAVSDISDGIFIFVPDVQKEAELQGESHCDGMNLLPSMIRAEIFRTDDPNDTSSKRTTAETLWVSAPGGDDLPVVVLKRSGT